MSIRPAAEWPDRGLLLVRHGESEWNAIGRWQGQADPALTDHGRAQARHAAGTLGPARRFVSSDLRRAAETAALLAEGAGRVAEAGLPGLRERAAGPWEGRTKPEIDAEWPGYLASGRRPPGYESDEALLRRVRTALSPLLDAARDTVVVVVAHGGILRALEQTHGAPERRVPNLSGRWIHGPAPESLGPRVHLLPPELETRHAST